MKFPRRACALVAFVALLGARVDGTDYGVAVPVRPTVTAQGGDMGGLFFGQKPDPQKTRRYYIAAEAGPWDFAPAGRDDVCGFALPPAVIANRTREKLRYIQYTDDTFTTRAIPNPALGVLGPVLRGVVGEFLAVTFLNRTTQPLSMHPHGVRYDKDSEGAYYRPGPGRGSAVGAGATFTYVWQLDEASGPMPGEPSSKAWLYHSHVLGDHESNLGLVGAIIVTDPKRARPDGTPADIDREFATLFMIFDESGPEPSVAAAIAEKNSPPASPPAGQPASPAAPPDWAQTQELAELGSRFGINGRIFGNLRGLDINEGERTRWYLFALGSEQDFHTAHWHGLRVVEEGRRRTDVVELLPASMKTVDLLADNPGSWLFHCHVAEHMREGMFARLTVYARDTVGVSRAPEAAFLGLPAAMRSIRIDHAERVLNLVAQPVRGEIVILGAVGAPENFAVADQTVRVRLGEREIDFRLNAQGIAREPLARLRINNITETGLAHGGRLDFELSFNGAHWLDEAAPPPATPGRPAAPERTLPLVIEIGPARHAADVRLVSRVVAR